MPGPDRWDQLEDPRDSTMDLPRITESPSTRHAGSPPSRVAHPEDPLDRARPEEIRPERTQHDQNPASRVRRSEDPPDTDRHVPATADHLPRQDDAQARPRSRAPGDQAVPHRPLGNSVSHAEVVTGQAADRDLSGPAESPDASSRPADPPGRAWDSGRRGPDQDRPERGSVAELRLRLERLPVGHPSSPYNDDGTRKPPVARLRHLELPLTSDERPSDAGARHDRPALGAAADRAQAGDTRGRDYPSSLAGPGSPPYRNGIVGPGRTEGSGPADPPQPDGNGLTDPDPTATPWPTRPSPTSTA
jgi:hypothetical protein